jgi:GxxExxY protein
MERDDQLTGRIIGCGIEVHRVLGPGLRERSYEEALAIEMAHQGVAYERQVSVGVQYRDHWIGDYRIDFVVEGTVIVEVKSAERLEPLFEAQILGYLRASRLHLALLMNFNSARLADSVRRYIR